MSQYGTIGLAVRRARRSSPPQANERLPPGVQEVLLRGGCHIGKLNDKIVLKYGSDLNDQGLQISIKIEKCILQIIGPHPRIIQSMGLVEDGLILKYYPNGTLHKYIEAHPDETLERRLEWCKQLVDTLSFVHSKRVIHCDICLYNMLLDENFNIILADFQGLLLSSVTGLPLLDGMTRESAKGYMPREHPYVVNVQTDLFSVGSAIYHIMAGHEVFPELDSFHDEDAIAARFVNEDFPNNDDYVASHIVEKCWRGEYSSAAEISADIAAVQADAEDVGKQLKQLDVEMEFEDDYEQYEDEEEEAGYDEEEDAEYEYEDEEDEEDEEVL
jgi:serine/threonine protein kinase